MNGFSDSTAMVILGYVFIECSTNKSDVVNQKKLTASDVDGGKIEIGVGPLMSAK